MMSETLRSSSSILEWPFTALSIGYNSSLLLMVPTITLCLPSINVSTALTPILDAKTRSKQDGDPPRCMCPKTDTLTS